MNYELGLPVKHLGRTLKAFMSLDVKTETGTYIEIGAHRGRSIVIIGSYLKDKVNRLHIKGYDIFANETQQFHIKEDNGKGAGNIYKCNNKLSKLSKRFPSVTYELIEGYTTDTLTSQTVEWAYIDGGHSYETVKWDHEQLKNSKVIVFDDSDLEGVNKYLWEIKDQYTIYDLELTRSRQSVIINDTDNYDFDSANLFPFGGCDPKDWRAIR